MTTISGSKEYNYNGLMNFNLAFVNEINEEKIATIHQPYVHNY